MQSLTYLWWATTCLGERDGQQAQYCKPPEADEPKASMSTIHPTLIKLPGQLLIQRKHMEEQAKPQHWPQHKSGMRPIAHRSLEVDMINMKPQKEREVLLQSA